MSIDFGSRNSSVGIILVMNFVFFAVWVTTMFAAVNHPALTDVTNKLYGVFIGVNNALMLILNAEAKNGNGKSDSNPTKPETPASLTK